MRDGVRERGRESVREMDREDRARGEWESKGERARIWRRGEWEGRGRTREIDTDGRHSMVGDRARGERAM